MRRTARPFLRPKVNAAPALSNEECSMFVEDVEVGEGHVGDETICPDCGEDLGEAVPHRADCRYANG